MRYTLKKLGCYVLILFLLPYIVTVFLNGGTMKNRGNVDDFMVRVRIRDAGTGAVGTDTAETDPVGSDTQAQDVAEDGIVEVSLREYAIGIMAKEIPVEYEPEALKAQAILVRTDIYTKLQNGVDTVLEDTYWTKKQMQNAWEGKNYSDYYKKLERAWKETGGQVVTYQDGLAKVPFFRLSNGSTRDGQEVLGSDAYPYLKIVDCPLDLESNEQVQTITIDDMDAEVTECDTAGYVKTVRVGNESINGEEFRTNYHLASSCFSLRKYNGKLRITTRGVGHGLGMSQNTANKMAGEGKTYEEILQYFFAGTELKEVTEIVAFHE